MWSFVLKPMGAALLEGENDKKEKAPVCKGLSHYT